MRQSIMPWEITKETYDLGWEVYRSKRSIKAVSRTCGVSYKTAKRMVREGYPDRRWEAYDIRLAKITLAASAALPRSTISFTREVMVDLKYMLHQATEQLLQYRDGLLLSEIDIKTMEPQQFLNLFEKFVNVTERMAKLEAFLDGKPEKTTKITLGLEVDEDPSTWSDERLQQFLNRYGIEVDLDQKQDDVEDNDTLKA